jgi:hypothetical protein
MNAKILLSRAMLVIHKQNFKRIEHCADFFVCLELGLHQTAISCTSLKSEAGKEFAPGQHLHYSASDTCTRKQA